jgi:hypothetical protein
MHLETLRDKLACEIADATYEKFQSEIYGLHLCKDCYSEIGIQSKRMLKDLLDNYSKQLGCYCNLDKIKDLR